jgi:hypothetical protein
MAPETYYFFFSILAVIAPGAYVANMAYYRVKGKNLVGLKFKPGTADYELMRKHSSNRGLVILGVVTLVGIVNLILDIYRLLHLPNQGDVLFLLIFAPSLVIVIAVAVTAKIYRQFGNGKYEKAKHKSGKDKDTWL